MSERVRIVMASDLPACECCGERWCPVHNQHFADCPCVGPHNAQELGYRVVEDDAGVLYAEKGQP